MFFHDRANALLACVLAKVDLDFILSVMGKLLESLRKGRDII